MRLPANGKQGPALSSLDAHASFELADWGAGLCMGAQTGEGLLMPLQNSLWDTFGPYDSTANAEEFSAVKWEQNSWQSM